MPKRTSLTKMKKDSKNVGRQFQKLVKKLGKTL